MSEQTAAMVAQLEGDSVDLLTEATSALEEALPDLTPQARATLLVGLVQARSTLALSLRLSLLNRTLRDRLSEIHGAMP